MNPYDRVGSDPVALRRQVASDLRDLYDPIVGDLADVIACVEEDGRPEVVRVALDRLDTVFRQFTTYASIATEARMSHRRPPLFRVFRSGPGCYYAQRVIDGQFIGARYQTRHAAQEWVDRKNAEAGS